MYAFIESITFIVLLADFLIIECFYSCGTIEGLSDIVIGIVVVDYIVLKMYS